MKFKGLFVALTFVFGLSFAGCVRAEVNVEDVTLYGDDMFIEKIKNLDTEAQPKKSLYVSPTGNDDNDGSINSPFKTINTAMDEAKAGTTVYVRGGTYTENVYFPNNGNADGYITLRNYPGETPVIKGTGKNDTPILDLDGHDYIHIEGLELCDSTAKWAYGILFAGGENHIIIRNNTIHDIKCSAPDDPDNSGANAILLFGEKKEPISNVYIADNNIYDLVTGWCEALSVTANCEYVNVINNRVNNSTNIGIDFYGNNADGYCPVEELNQPRYCIAAGNEVSNCVCSYADSYGIYVDGARDIIIENNISHNNQGGIEIGSEELNENYPVKNILVRNNLVYDNSVKGITVGGWNDGSSKGDPLSGVVTQTKIYNNTLVNNDEQLHLAMVDGLEIANNILYSNNNTPIVASDVDSRFMTDITFKNNLYYAEGRGASEAEFEVFEQNQQGMDSFKAITGENGSYGDPDFEADYSLKGTSIAIDKGAAIDYGNKDLANNDRVQGTAVDIGAYEYIQETAKTLYGDMDNDGDVTANDAAIALSLTLNGDNTSEGVKMADVDLSGAITSNDSANILKKSEEPGYLMPVEMN